MRHTRKVLFLGGSLLAAVLVVAAPSQIARAQDEGYTPPPEHPPLDTSGLDAKLDDYVKANPMPGTTVSKSVSDNGSTIDGGQVTYFQHGSPIFIAKFDANGNLISAGKTPDGNAFDVMKIFHFGFFGEEHGITAESLNSDGYISHISFTPAGSPKAGFMNFDKDGHVTSGEIYAPDGHLVWRVAPPVAETPASATAPSPPPAPPPPPPPPPTPTPPPTVTTSGTSPAPPKTETPPVTTAAATPQTTTPPATPTNVATPTITTPVSTPAVTFTWDTTTWCMFHPTFPLTVPLVPPGSPSLWQPLTLSNLNGSPPPVRFYSDTTSPPPHWSSIWESYWSETGIPHSTNDRLNWTANAIEHYWMGPGPTPGMTVNPGNGNQEQPKQRQQSGPPPVYFNVKASSTAIQTGENANQLPGQMLKGLPASTVNPNLPWTGMKDAETGHNNNPIQGVTGGPDNSLTLPINPAIFGFEKTFFGPSYSVGLVFDPNRTSIIENGGGSMPGGMLGQNFTIGGMPYQTAWTTGENAQSLTSGGGGLFDMNWCWTHLPYAPGRKFARVDPHKALPGATLRLAQIEERAHAN